MAATPLLVCFLFLSCRSGSCHEPVNDRQLVGSPLGDLLKPLESVLSVPGCLMRSGLVPSNVLNLGPQIFNGLLVIPKVWPQHTNVVLLIDCFVMFSLASCKSQRNVLLVISYYLLLQSTELKNVIHVNRTAMKKHFVTKTWRFLIIAVSVLAASLSFCSINPSAHSSSKS